jgi:hypothetical protein
MQDPSLTLDALRNDTSLTGMELNGVFQTAGAPIPSWVGGVVDWCGIVYSHPKLYPNQKFVKLDLAPCGTLRSKPATIDEDLARHQQVWASADVCPGPQVSLLLPVAEAPYFLGD